MATGSRPPPSNRRRSTSPPATASSPYIPPDVIPEIAKRLTSLQDFFALRAACRAYRAALPLTPSNLASRRRSSSSVPTRPPIQLPYSTSRFVASSTSASIMKAQAQADATPSSPSAATSPSVTSLGIPAVLSFASSTSSPASKPASPATGTTSTASSSPATSWSPGD
ncbi:unnamed protein product [Urochloa humidicola]